MKQRFGKAALLAFCFLLGWFGHLAVTYDPQTGVQWEFVDAAQRGDIRSLEKLMQRGAKVDDRPTYAAGAVAGFSPLWMAANAGQSGSTQWLLDHGADPNQWISDSCPLDAAEGRVKEASEAVAILKAHGAKNLLP